jgi:hypothetical protein
VSDFKNKSLPADPYEALAEVAKHLNAAIKMDHMYPDGACKRSFTGAVLSIETIYGLQWLAHEANLIACQKEFQPSS